ncbi:hypothetical protein [Mesorhizobium sp. ISC15]|uniref:hypothetical protein n=1 Tax=Mesorhizobium sp. ISC15 TaxID=3076429 RepID=UPI00301CE19B
MENRSTRSCSNSDVVLPRSLALQLRATKKEAVGAEAVAFELPASFLLKATGFGSSEKLAKEWHAKKAPVGGGDERSIFVELDSDVDARIDWSCAVRARRIEFADVALPARTSAAKPMESYSMHSLNLTSATFVPSVFFASSGRSDG